jgi:ribosomal protein S19E (S16A)
MQLRRTGEHAKVPWYYWEAATIYRKLKRYDEEVVLIRRFARNYGVFSKRYRPTAGSRAWAAKFLERFDTARAAAAAHPEDNDS